MQSHIKTTELTGRLRELLLLLTQLLAKTVKAAADGGKDRREAVLRSYWETGVGGRGRTEGGGERESERERGGSIQEKKYLMCIQDKWKRSMEASSMRRGTW